jgi:hypothetical protein
MHKFIRNTSKHILKKYCIVPILQKNKKLINRIDNLLTEIILHFNQDFRHQIDNRIYINGIFDYVSMNSDFNLYAYELYDILICGLDSYNSINFINININKDNFIYLIYAEITNFLKSLLSKKYNYKIINKFNINNLSEFINLDLDCLDTDILIPI